MHVDRSEFASNLKAFRQKFGMSQQQLADRLGITRMSVGAYEEARATPPLNVLLKMKEAFFLNKIEELLHEPGDIPVITAKDRIFNRYALLAPDKRKIVDFILNISPAQEQEPDDL